MVTSQRLLRETLHRCQIVRNQFCQYEQRYCDQYRNKQRDFSKKNNKEIDTETLTEKSFDAEMVTESTSSNSKDVQDEANPLQRSFRIRTEPNQLMYCHNH